MKGMDQKERTSYVWWAIVFFAFFISMEVLGGIYLSALSFRHLAVLGAFAYCLLHVNQTINVLRRERVLSFFILVVYFLYVSLLGVFNGLYDDDFGSTLVLARFLPFVVGFFFYLLFFKDEAYVQIGLVLLFLFFELDVFLSILQGLNVDFGWTVRDFLFPEDSEWMVMEDRENSIGYSIVPGFFVSSVENGYFLASYGCLNFLFPLKRKSNVFFCVNLCLTLLALILTQQRMAMYVFLFACLVLSFYMGRKNRVLFFLFVSIIVLFVVFDSNIDFGRLSKLEDQKRVSMIENFFSFFPDNLLLGNRSQYVAMYKVTPHSIFMETFLFGGVVGVLLIALFIASLLFLSASIASRKGKEPVVYVISVLAFLLISFTHSSGFHTGFTIVLPLYVLLIKKGSRSECREA